MAVTTVTFSYRAAIDWIASQRPDCAMSRFEYMDSDAVRLVAYLSGNDITGVADDIVTHRIATRIAEQDRRAFGDAP